MIASLETKNPDGSTIEEGSVLIMRDGVRTPVSLDNYFHDISSHLSAQEFNKKFFQGELMKMSKGAN